MPKTKKFKPLQIVMPHLITDADITYRSPLLYLGEIPNMPGYCVLVNKNGKVLWGYHPEDFREPTEDEI